VCARYTIWARTNCGAWRAEQFPHLGNYTLTPGNRVGEGRWMEGNLGNYLTLLLLGRVRMGKKCERKEANGKL